MAGLKGCGLDPSPNSFYPCCFVFLFLSVRFLTGYLVFYWHGTVLLLLFLDYFMLLLSGPSSCVLEVPTANPIATAATACHPLSLPLLHCYCRCHCRCTESSTLHLCLSPQQNCKSLNYVSFKHLFKCCGLSWSLPSLGCQFLDHILVSNETGQVVFTFSCKLYVYTFWVAFFVLSLVPYSITKHEPIFKYNGLQMLARFSQLYVATLHGMAVSICFFPPLQSGWLTEVGEAFKYIFCFFGIFVLIF